MRLFAMVDDPSVQSPPKEVGMEEAARLNKKGYGIFHLVNEFKGSRKKENLEKIKFWYMEFDKGSKEHQMKQISKMDIVPSIVIESKNGYHVYFRAADARPENYKEIQKRMGYWCGADQKVQDISRLLRSPDFYHMKDPSDPFLVKVVWNHSCTYNERLMLYAFPAIPESEETSDPYQMKEKVKSTLKVNEGDDFFDAIHACDQKKLLERLSGTSYVNHEVYSFKRVGETRYNIFVNGKGTSCFIDEHRKIGSTSGPTIWGWLHWYGHKHPEIYRIIKQEFPELCS